MLRTMCNSNIHRATAAGADLDDIGSVTIDPELMEAAMERYRPRFIFVGEHNRITPGALRAVSS